MMEVDDIHGGELPTTSENLVISNISLTHSAIQMKTADFLRRRT